MSLDLNLFEFLLCDKIQAKHFWPDCNVAEGSKLLDEVGGDDRSILCKQRRWGVIPWVTCTV